MFETRFPYGFPPDFSTKDFIDYIYLRITEYINGDLIEELLCEAICEDFGQFTIDAWKQVPSEARRELRTLLLQRVVYVESRKALLVSDRLHSVITNVYQF